MKLYERLRESPNPALNSIVLEFPDGNQLADIVDTSLVMPR
jgi:hypothetical protein